jgi:DMSO/TMAO reductase YedYZ molybdopterin-dependent catalytic subunit
MPKTIQNAELYCYGDLLASGEWGGVQLNYLLYQTGVSWEVNSIQFTAIDFYVFSIPIQVAQAPQTLIAYQTMKV